MDTTNEVILDLLNEAAAAHGVFEAKVLGGVYDQKWPAWYAAHMASSLAARGYRLVMDAAEPDTTGVGR